MTTIVIAALTGAGLMTGLLFAFSNFALRALADLPSDKGMIAMQRVNERIINPLFLVLFFGTPVLCVVIATMSVARFDDPGSRYFLFGAIAYLLGPFGIKVLFNVPLNNRLAEADASEADRAWPEYRARWQPWNHARTCVGVAAIVLLGAGLGSV
jgi:uncharacterized membrane protein